MKVLLKLLKERREIMIKYIQLSLYLIRQWTLREIREVLLHLVLKWMIMSLKSLNIELKQCCKIKTF